MANYSPNIQEMNSYKNSKTKKKKLTIVVAKALNCQQSVVYIEKLTCQTKTVCFLN